MNWRQYLSLAIFIGAFALVMVFVFIGIVHEEEQWGRDCRDAGGKHVTLGNKDLCYINGTVIRQ